jgi:cobalamin biosynthesis protein CbiD
MKNSVHNCVHTLKDTWDLGRQMSAQREMEHVIKDSAIEEESDNKVDELQESTIKKKLLSSGRDGTDAVTNYVDSSINKKLHEYCEHLRTVREILSTEQQQRSVQTKLDSFFKPALLL